MLIDWDDGNWPKCGKHGVSKEEIERLFAGEPMIFWDSDHSLTEFRLRAVGQVGARYVLVAYTRRARDDEVYVRPISARYMNAKEVRYYEEAKARKRLSPDR